MRTRTNFRQFVQKADPDWERDHTIEPEYEFQVPTKGRPNDLGLKIFYGRTAERGPYAED